MKTSNSFAPAALVLMLGVACLHAQVPQLLHYQGRAVVGSTNFDGVGQFKFALVDSGQPSRQAAASVSLFLGGVGMPVVTDRGYGYTSVPAVGFSGGGGSGASAHAVLAAGKVISLVIDNPGSGYFTAPTVAIDPPPSGPVFKSFWSNDGSSTAGSEPASAVTLPVARGLYAVLLGDTTYSNMTAVPPDVFANSNLCLRVWFNDGAHGSQQVTPDQRIAAVGYAMIAASVSDGAVTAAKLGAGAVTADKLAAGAVTSDKIGPGTVTSALSFSNPLNTYAGDGGGMTNLRAGALVARLATVVTWGDSSQTNVPAVLNDVVGLAAGNDFSLALRADGTVVGWGDNYAGQTTSPPGLNNVKRIAAGTSHSLALKTDGTVVAWGDNYYGETNVPAGLQNVSAICGGASYSAALSNGSVVVWGYNWGQGNVPSDLSGVVALAAGWMHILALKNDGTVVAWGDNQAGQTNVPAGLSGVMAVAAGIEHNLVLCSNGTVVAWGGNTWGQTNMPVGLSGVVAVAAGGYGSLALKSDGTVVAWGASYMGQTNVPAGLNQVVAVAVGGLHDLALRTQDVPARLALLDQANLFNGANVFSGANLFNGTFTGNGAGLVSLDPGKLTSGTVTGALAFNGPVTATSLQAGTVTATSVQAGTVTASGVIINAGGLTFPDGTTQYTTATNSSSTATGVSSGLPPGSTFTVSFGGLPAILSGTNGMRNLVDLGSDRPLGTLRYIYSGGLTPENRMSLQRPRTSDPTWYQWFQANALQPLQMSLGVPGGATVVWSCSAKVFTYELVARAGGTYEQISLEPTNFLTRTVTGTATATAPSTPLPEVQISLDNVLQTNVVVLPNSGIRGTPGSDFSILNDVQKLRANPLSDATLYSLLRDHSAILTCVIHSAGTDLISGSYPKVILYEMRLADDGLPIEEYSVVFDYPP